MSSYFLAADSTRIDGKRYIRGDELPAEDGAKLAERGYAVTDRVVLDERQRLPLVFGAAPKADEHSTLNQEAGHSIGISDSNGIHEEGTSTTVADTESGAVAPKATPSRAKK